MPAPNAPASSPPPLSPPLRAALAALHLVPKALLSRAVGHVASWTLPPSIARHAIRAVGRAVGVDFSEMRDPIDAFPTLQAFFTRALAPGVRPVDPAPEAVVSPCDGAFGACGRIQSGSLLQIKGRPYSLAALLGDARDAAAFEGGDYATLYLAPRDYHRFHAPCALRATRLRYLPGALFPVNRLGVEGIDALFARNERLCAFFALEGAAASESICIVAVGATVVGKVRVVFDDLTTNVPGAGPATRAYGAHGPRIAKGEEWGRFELGSTLVLVAAPGSVALAPRPAGARARLGERIGALVPAGSRRA